MKFEETIDFFISWTIRCADNKYREINPLLHFYSKRILSKLFNGDEHQFKNKCIHDIEVWKQHRNIDLWVEFRVEGCTDKNALVIEDKMYSSIRSGQLGKYRTIVTDYYANQPGCNKKFVLLRPDYTIGMQYNELEICKEANYEYLNLEELQALLTSGKTGNDLFDEFWFNWGGEKNKDIDK